MYIVPHFLKSMHAAYMVCRICDPLITLRWSSLKNTVYCLVKDRNETEMAVILLQ